MHNRVAFTLVELLTVIAVIALLISLLLPALGQAKHVAREAQCGSNLHQIGVAVFAYCSDNMGRFPQYSTLAECPVAVSLLWNNRAMLWGSGGSAPRKLTRYMGEFVARCPLDTGYRPGSGLPLWFEQQPFYLTYGSSYIYQSAVYDAGGTSTPFGWPVKYVLWNSELGKVRRASKLLMAGDFTIEYIEFFTWPGNGHLAFIQMHDPTEFRLNSVFADGHVTAHVMKEPPNHLSNVEYEVFP